MKNKEESGKHIEKQREKLAILFYSCRLVVNPR